jgi:FtsZ-binding cell division protein ZapB
MVILFVWLFKICIPLLFLFIYLFIYCVLQAMCKDIDRQREIERLKCENDLLSKRINNRDSLNIIQLEAKNTRLEQEKRSLQLIIDALCTKINKDSEHELKEAC